MDTFNVMLVLIVIGLLMLSIGYARRDSGWGLGLMSLGILCMLATLVYKMYIMF